MIASAGEYPWDIRKVTLAALGWEPSDDQLKYWREKHAIRSLDDVPHPSGQGRVSLYAPGTANLIRALKPLLDTEHSLAVATWTLWTEGYEFNEVWTRQRLLDAAAEWDSIIEIVRERGFQGKDQSAFSDDFLNSFDEGKRFYDRRLRLVRKLVGSKFLLTFMFHMIRLALGHKLSRPPSHSAVGQNGDEWSREHDIVVTGLGFDRMLIDKAAGAAPITKADVIGPLDKVAEALTHGPLLAHIQAATDLDLLCAAREITAVKANNRFLYKALAWVFGRHAFGRGHAARMFDEYSNADDVLLTALWVAVRGQFRSQLPVEIQLHQESAAEKLAAMSAQAEQLAAKEPGLKRTIMDKIKGKRGR